MSDRGGEGGAGDDSYPRSAHNHHEIVRRAAARAPLSEATAAISRQCDRYMTCRGHRSRFNKQLRTAAKAAEDSDMSEASTHFLIHYTRPGKLRDAWLELKLRSGVNPSPK